MTEPVVLSPPPPDEAEFHRGWQAREELEGWEPTWMISGEMVDTATALRRVLEDREERGYQRGYNDGHDQGRIEAINRGFSDAWDAGWKGAVKWLLAEARLREHRRAGLARGDYCNKTGEDNAGDCPCLDGAGLYLPYKEAGGDV